MSARRRRVVSVGFAALAIVGAPTFIAVRAARYALASVTPANREIAPSVRASASAAHPTLREITFVASDGVRLRGWFIPASNGATILFVHGGGGDRTQLFPDAEVLARHGFGVLVYDARGAGESDAATPTWGDHEQRDLRAAIDFAIARPDVDPKRLGVVGFSIGASTVAMVAAEDPRLRAVVLYATWTTLRDEIDYKFRRYGAISRAPATWVLRRAGVDFDAVRPIDVIAKIHPRALFMIIGVDDADTPTWVAERIFAAAGEPKSLWEIPGVKHGGYVQAEPVEYERRVVAFFESALLAPSAR
jgi:dipeptidyl aminopeptidase/acylaminoacyl peptidase